MDKDGLPSYNSLVADQIENRRRRRRLFSRRSAIQLLALLCLSAVTWRLIYHGHSRQITSSSLRAARLRQDYAVCSKLQHKPKDPAGQRSRSARFVEGSRAVLIKNATIWSGEPAPGSSQGTIHSGDAFSWFVGDVLLEHGLIKRVTREILSSSVKEDHIVYNAHRRPLTAGIVDMHSHAGVMSLPSLPGGEDTNELSDDITPYIRSIDGLDPLDPQIRVIKSGGVTTSLILPGSGNNIGGEAFVIKHAVGKEDGRPELSIKDLLADPEGNWRYMKMACGKNAKRVSESKIRNNGGPFSRLGEAWYFRHAFEEAARLVQRQDEWCAAARDIGPTNMAEHLPLDLRWESLGAVLRGQVRVNTHCYTVPDLESFVGYTNEFNFTVRAFHHAHQTYLIPEVLKRAYGDKPPAAALFADNMYYKVESYIASEQAGRILYDQGITPVYVSDNPVINAQHVLFEAAKAYRNGLPYHAALAGVTSAPADLLGLGHRIGKVAAGFDADVVVWDADPLSVGATPLQVWIDGTPQFKEPFELNKPLRRPIIMDEGVAGNIKIEDVFEGADVVVTGIKEVLLDGRTTSFAAGNEGTLITSRGRITCLGRCIREAAAALGRGVRRIELQNGHISPGLSVFGSSLGLAEIEAEEETQDGINSAQTFSAAVDGLLLDGKNLRAAHAHGVTKAISPPLFKGVSTIFRTNATHSLEAGAILENHVALHYSLTPDAKQDKTPTLSGVIGDLRKKLLKAVHHDSRSNETDSEERFLYRVVHESFPLVLKVHSADMIATILRVKSEVEAEIATKTSPVNMRAASLNIVIHGGAESHLVATEIASSGIAVVLAPLRPYSVSWDQRRSLTGAPLTNGTTLDALIAAGVPLGKIAIGIEEDWEARDLMLAAGIAFENSISRMSLRDAIGLVSTNILSILTLDKTTAGAADVDFVVYEGSPLDITSQIRVIASDGRSVKAWQ